DTRYINASLIQAIPPFVRRQQISSVEHDQPAYIATQAPLPDTIGDFWRLIYQENVTVIIMLAPSLGENLPDFEVYWPPTVDECRYHAYDTSRLTVTLVAETAESGYMLRKFTVTSASPSSEVAQVSFGCKVADPAVGFQSPLRSIKSKEGGLDEGQVNGSRNQVSDVNVRQTCGTGCFVGQFKFSGRCKVTDPAVGFQSPLRSIVVWIVPVLTGSEVPDTGLCFRILSDKCLVLRPMYDDRHERTDEYAQKLVELGNLSFKRNLILDESEDPLEVTQFQLLNWPEHGLPNIQEFSGMLTAYRRFKYSETDQDAPTLVHCSNGAGRTGAFIAADTLMDHLEESAESIDLASIVTELRGMRMNMVQKN
ncbi:hypothetical protein T265_13563, partial [Opisthorchis viverrini]